MKIPLCGFNLTGSFPFVQKPTSSLELLHTEAPRTWLQAMNNPTAFKRLKHFINPLVLASQNKGTKSSGLLYSGTSLKALERIIRNSGGTLDPKKTFFASDAGFPFSYARAAARRDSSPGIILEFSADVLAGKIKLGHMQPIVNDERGGRPIQLATFYQATAPIHLNELDAAVKELILGWLSQQAPLRPGYTLFWNEQLNIFEQALYPSAAFAYQTAAISK
ncbi:MAG: hypothetical protein ABII18_00810 [bacterium]|nr:hypothetical protein [bacterium]MBU1916573.1 hypothetical protein [bacterium]